MTGLPRTEGSLAGAAPGPADGRPRTSNSAVPAPSADTALAQARGAKPAVRWYRGLSGQLLVLTILFVMLAEVMIFVPSIARERMSFLNATIADADLATLALEETPNNMVSPELARRLLDTVGVRAIVLRGGQISRLVLADVMPPALDVTIDLRETTLLGTLDDSLVALVRGGNRVVRLIGTSSQTPGARVEVVMDEAPLLAHLRLYAGEILSVSILISLVTALLVYFALHWRLVRPMARVTQSMVDFRHDPSNPWAVIRPGTREDEIGIAERELAAMQIDLRGALRQNRRLAELGQAVSKISHDLRNILATATLVSDRIALIDDPEVQRLAPTLLRSVDRAVTLASETLRYGRAEEPVPHRSKFDLHDLMEDVGTSAGVGQVPRLAWKNEVPAPFAINADRDQVFRALLNITRNAVQAMDGGAEASRGAGGQVVARAERVNGHVAIDIIDTGPGLPPKAREALFRPFAGSARAGGTGLGLAIARDIARAHRGEIHLVRSDERGTQFRLEIPDA